MEFYWNDLVSYNNELYTVAYVGLTDLRLVNPINLLDADEDESIVIWVPKSKVKLITRRINL